MRIAPELALTGIKAQIEPLDFLPKKPLDGFHAIYLLNVERLTAAEARRLRSTAAPAAEWCFFWVIARRRHD